MVGVYNTEIHAFRPFLPSSRFRTMQKLSVVTFKIQSAEAECLLILVTLK